MKFKIILLMVIIPQFLFAEDIFFRVIETTPFWNDINFPRPERISGEIPKGSIVKGDSGTQFSGLEGIYDDILFQVIIYNDKSVLVFADSLIPIETQDLFDQSLLHNPGRPLVSSFFVDALRTNNREIIYTHDKLAWDAYLDKQGKNEALDWRFYVGGHENLTITQTTLTFSSDAKNSSDLLIKNIKKTEEGYIITVKEAATFQDRNEWWNWPNPNEQELFTVLLILDGDFIDLYLNNKNTLIDKFAYVNKGFLAQIDNLLRAPPVDLTDIIWPRRADGSMDYPPPSVNTSNDQNSLEESEQVVDSKTTLESESPQTTKDSQFPLWLFIGGGLVLAAVGVVVAVIVKKRR